MARRIILCLLLLLLAKTALADSPMMPQSYAREAGAYVFVMLAPGAPPLLSPTGAPYPRSGLYPKSGSVAPIWTVDWYAFDVFPAADGRHLARLGPWPTQGDFSAMAVAFYRDGAPLASYQVSDLVSQPERLPKSVSHYMWLRSHSYDPATNLLTIVTEADQTLRFSLANGRQVLPPPDPLWRAVWPWAAGAGALAAAVLLLAIYRHSRH